MFHDDNKVPNKDSIVQSHKCTELLQFVVTDSYMYSKCRFMSVSHVVQQV